MRTYTSNGKQVPQLTVLKNYESSSITEFINHPQDGEYIFCIADSSNFEKHTGYHTSTALSLFALLREKKLVSDEHLSEVKVLLLKEFLIFNL